MRRLFLLFAVLALAVYVPLAAPAAAQSEQKDYADPDDSQQGDHSNARVVRLSLVEGQAQVFRPERGEWDEALLNLPIQKAYAVATGQGRVEIEFESGATARLDENSEIEFTDLSLYNGARITVLRLERGSAIFYANLEKNDHFQVVAAGRRVSIPRNARIRMDVNGGAVVVAVLKGKAEVETPSGTVKVSKEQELRLSEDGAVETARHSDADDFELWALNREEVVTAAWDNSSRYVSAPFRYGVSDLSRYGYWYHDLTYGYVWQPTAAGFTPYVNGNWIWVNGFGWSWVGFEPWGWLPYHFGSWFFTGYGWAWVPGGFHHWRPAHVSWIRFHDGSLGWCPRNPHDRPGHRPRNLHHGTATMTGGRPVIRNVTDTDTPTVMAARPTRDNLDVRPQFAGRNPRTDRSGVRGPDGRPVDSTAGGAPARGGYSGSTGAPGFGGRPDANSTSRGSGFDRGDDSNSRRPGAQGDVHYDPNTHRYVNTPTRDAEDRADTPRSGWGGSNGRPRPSFSPAAGDSNGAGGSDNGRPSRYTPSAPDNSGPRSSGNSGYSGRAPQSSGQRPDSSSAPPRSSAPPSQPSQPRYTPPSPPPQRPSSPPSSGGYGSRPSSPPPSARPSSPPPRPSASASRPTSSSMVSRPSSPRPAPSSPRRPS